MAKPLEARECCPTPLISGLKDTRGYTILNLSEKENSHKGAPSTQESQAFNPGIIEVETGVVWLGREGNIKQEKTGLHYSLRLMESIATVVTLSTGLSLSLSEPW